MRFASLARRFVPTLFAALVLLATLASSAHTHATPARGPALAAEAAGAAHGSVADFGCALCAHGERLAHGAALAPASATVVGLGRGLTRVCERSSPPRVLLERLAPRAPPRIG
ncbi:MAG: hypothetical protein FJ091_14140 [Deltaproteobacteria bacterium]|nr:hypothetical protein [Deltaproteobacteria bacterium]